MQIFSVIITIIGLSLGIVGVIIVSWSLLIKENYDKIIKTILDILEKISKVEKYRFPEKSKKQFFEYGLKIILAHLSSYTIENQGKRMLVGLVYIIIGFLFQLVGQLFSIIPFKLLKYSLLLILILYVFFILKNLFKHNKQLKVFLKNKDAKLSLPRRITINFLTINASLMFSFLFKFALFILKITFNFSKYVSGLGMKKEERDRLGEKAYEEFIINYGERWDKISDDLFEKTDNV